MIFNRNGSASLGIELQRLCVEPLSSAMAKHGEALHSNGIAQKRSALQRKGGGVPGLAWQRISHVLHSIAMASRSTA